MARRKDIVLVTGGTGFIGGRVVDGLVKRGFRCRVFSNRVAVHDDPSVEYILSDIRDAGAVDTACKGARYVCHLAAALTENPKDPDFLFDINVLGTRNVIAAAKRHGVERIVHISSTSAVSFGGRGILDERSMVRRTTNWTPYAKSKALAELEIESAGNGIHWTMLYPTRVFGIGPLEECNAAAMIVLLHVQGRFPILPGGGTSWANWAYVDDVARGIVSAVTSARSGERYLLGGENATLAQAFALARNHAGVKRFVFHLPHLVGRSVAALEEARAWAARDRPRITREWYNAIAESIQLSCCKAERELGYHVTPLDSAIGLVVTALMNNGNDRRRTS